MRLVKNNVHGNKTDHQRVVMAHIGGGHARYNVYEWLLVVVGGSDWRMQKLLSTDDWLPEQVSSSLKTRQGSCQTVVDVLSTVTIWMESRVM